MEWFLAISILFGGWQFNRADNLADRVEVAEKKAELMAGVANNNAADSIKLEEILNENKIIIGGVSADLNQCAEKLREYSAKESGYRDSQVINQMAIKALEKSIAGSDLSSCRVPDRVADEIARDSHKNQGRVGH